MHHFWIRAVVLAAVVPAACIAQPSKPSYKGDASASGVLAGRSGKPMGNARVFLGKVEDTEDVLQGTVRLGGLPIAQTDAQGRFKISGFAPGRYTLMYSPAGGASIVPTEISIKALQAVTRSILPQMNAVEIGLTQPLDERKWGTFTLLKGHTFWGQGANMKIWNATLRRGATGPYLEVRKGWIWQEDFKDKAEIKLEAWGF